MIRPMNDWILVEPNPEETVTEGGILIPDESRRTAVKTGVVKAVGPGRVTKKGVQIPLEVKVGDTVAYIFALEKTRTGEGIKASLGTDEFLIKESDVLAVYEQ